MLETARLDVHPLKAAETDKLRPYMEIAPRKLAKRIRSRGARLKGLELDYPKRAVAKAIAALEAV